MVILLFFILEFIAFLMTKIIRRNFEWFITSNDQKPVLSDYGLKKFLLQGFDQELGWVRKPNTEHFEYGKYGRTIWKTNEKGSRLNPKFEDVKSKISCYGDSFTFCRQVNDDETWEYYLSKITKTNVLNFGVGNYGMDQAILRLQREFPKNQTEIVIIAVVPDSIRRILNVWKHYFEYGNTFGFKPRFIISNNKLELIKNPIIDKECFQNYSKFLPYIQKFDYFYKNKFCKELIKFPYFFHILKNPQRNITIIFWFFTAKIFQIFRNDSKFSWNAQRTIMRINLKWRIKLFEDKSKNKLFIKITEHFVDLSKSLKFKPILLILPQKDDIIFIKKNYHFYEKTIETLEKIPRLDVIDATTTFLKIKNIDEMYSDNNEYGGHLSKEGNELVASIVHDFFQTKKLLNNT